MLKNLHNYLKNLKDPQANFKLGLEYESIGQDSSAVSFFLRTANFTNDDELAYVCILKMAQCFDRLGNRTFSVETTMQQAQALLPKRPEAYFLLGQFQERRGKYLESYVTVSTGLEVADFDAGPLPAPVGYVGKWGLIFEQAVGAWHCGKEDKSRFLFQTLIDDHWDYMDAVHRSSVENNAIRLGCQPVSKTHKKYLKNHLPYLKYPFPGVEKIEQNFAQVYQDLFVLYMTNGKTNGTFLEIGGAKPFEGNNSALLEKDFGWCGVSIEFDQNFVDDYRAQRPKTSVLCQDALTTDYNELIQHYYGNIEVIDYLQLDIEPAASTYQALLKIPFDRYDFAVITYEHDYYADMSRSYKQKSRKYLESMGYELVVADVTPIASCSFEDWWVNPDLVDRELIEKIKNVDSREVLIKEHFFSNKKKDVLIETPIKREVINIKPIDELKKWQHWPAPTMEITTIIPEKGCVVDCAFCPQRVLEEVYSGTRILTLDNFKKLIDKIPTDVRITFAGFTEPWMNKYCTDMLLYAHEQGHPISVFTTGVGVSIEDLERIVDVPYHGNPNGGFTLHLPDSEMLARHPITPGYLQTLKWLKNNHHRIKNFSTMSMGSVHPSVKHLFEWAPTFDMWSRAGNLVRESLLKPKLINLKNRWNAVYHEDNSRTCGCEEHLYHNVLLPNGDVVLCCMDYGLEQILGNLYNQTYEDIIPMAQTCFDLCNYCENGVNYKPLP